MLWNYLRITWRHLLRHKTYVAINVIGLGIALSCSVIAYLNWKYNHDFDTQHPERERIFRLLSTKASDGELYGIAPLGMATAAATIPGVESALRMERARGILRNGEAVFNQEIWYADADFFDFFHFDFLQGTSAALTDPAKVIITETIAKQYFGDGEALGKVLTLNPHTDQAAEWIIGAVVADAPLNTTITFDVLTNFQNLRIENEPPREDDWSYLIDVIFLKLTNPAAAAAVDAKVDQYVERQHQAREDWAIQAWSLASLPELVDISRDMNSYRLRQNFPPSAVWGPMVMAILLLLTACLNFANTTISLANRRVREMGVRKVMGGSRPQIMGQLLGESFVICLLATLLSLWVTDILLPPYNRMWPWLELQTDYLHNWPLLAFLAGILVLTTLLAGAYPAAYLSHFNPVQVFRASTKFGGSSLFARLLLGLQVAISLIAVISGLGFARNARYQANADLGYNHRSTMLVALTDEGQYHAMRRLAEQHPAVESVAGSAHVMGFYYYVSDFLMPDGESRSAEVFELGDGYLETMEMQVEQGRAFDPALETDYEQAVLVNEHFVKTYFPDGALNQRLTLDSTEFQIVGVVKDFFSESFFDPIQPTILRLTRPENYNYLVVRTAPGQLLAVNEHLRTEWRSAFPELPYTGIYQDEALAQSLRVNDNIKWIMLFLAVVAGLLMMTGLMALISLNVVQRLREIAVRKVVGARLRQVTVLLSRNFLWIFLLAALLGAAGGVYLTNLLMDSIFSHNAGLNHLVVLPAVLALFVGVGFIIWLKVRQAWVRNPAEVLRAD